MTTQRGVCSRKNEKNSPRRLWDVKLILAEFYENQNNKQKYCPQIAQATRVGLSWLLTIAEWLAVSAVDLDIYLGAYLSVYLSSYFGVSRCFKIVDLLFRAATMHNRHRI